ncbi:MAG: TetR/AcrR family transcriptional regulator [Bacteroidota bacterium]
MPRTKAFDEAQVLTQAMELFWEKGYHATSMQDLVKYVGVNRASLYGAFKHKKDLFLQAFHHYRNSNAQKIQQFLQSRSDVKEGLRELFRNALARSNQRLEQSRGCFAVNITTELLPGDPEVQAILKENQAHFEQIFLAYLERGVSAGQISPRKNLSALASLLFTLYNGLNVIIKLNPDEEAIFQSLDTFLMLLDGE